MALRDLTTVAEARWFLEELFADARGRAVLVAGDETWWFALPKQISAMATKYASLDERGAEVALCLGLFDREHQVVRTVGAVAARTREWDHLMRGPRPSLWWSSGDKFTGLWLLTAPVDELEADVATGVLARHLHTATNPTRAGVRLPPRAEFKRGAPVPRPEGPLPTLLSVEDLMNGSTPHHGRLRRYDFAELASLPEWDPNYDEDVRDERRRQRARETAREELARERAEARYRRDGGRPDDADLSFAEVDEQPMEPTLDAVDGLLGEGHNLILTGVRGLGKSTLGAEIAVSMVDSTLLFGEIATHLPDDASVGIVNLEMSRRDVRLMLRRLGPENPHRLFVWTAPSVVFAGHPGDDLAAWVRAHDIRVLVVDSLRRAARVQSVSDNAELDRFYETLDEFKLRAGIDNLLIVAHPPRHAPDQVLGGMVSEAWTDELWSWEAVGPHRLLKLQKQRNLENPRGPLLLRWDAATGRNSPAAPSPERVPVKLSRADHGLLAVGRSPKVRGMGEMRKHVQGVRGNYRDEALQAAETQGFIIIHRDRPFRFELTESGHMRLEELRGLVGATE